MPEKNHTLVSITEQSHDLKLSLAYATPNNFTGTKVYKHARCYLHQAASDQLLTAIELLKPLRLGFKLWDGYRPPAAQQQLFNHMPDPNYVSPPGTGLCPHCRGVAIDLTLTDQYGNELEMGTAFDDFRSLAHHGNDQVSRQAQQNRLILAGVMSIAGFEPLATEWWHYQLPDPLNYPIIEDDDITSTIL